MRRRRLSSISNSLAALGLLAIAPAAFADSFAINEYSARDLGLANAGRATQTGDAGAAFGNPALLVRLHRAMVTGNVSSILGDAQFDDRGSTDLLGGSLGGDTSGFLKDAIVPALHAVYPLNERMALGLSVTAPFGLSTKYDSDWAGRYQAIKSSLRTIDINPSFSWQATDTLSLGVGVSAQYAKATLTSAIDFGAVCFGSFGPTTCGTLGLTPQSADGYSQIEGDDWKFGWNAGLAWTPNANWTVGLTYRDGPDHKLKGDALFSVPSSAAILTGTGAFSNTTGSAKLNLPAEAELGVRWQTTPKLALYASTQWKQWSDLKELRVDFDNPAQPDSAEPLNYQDSTRYSIGGEYALSDKWMVRAGFALDQSPTQAAFRTARIPDNDRKIYALGASWTPSDAWQMDVAYNRIEIDDTAFDKTGNFGDELTGLYSGHADVISIGATRRF
jgi:long-chain fatty acid transport protein